MWLGTSGKSGFPGHCLENPLQGCHPVQLEEWALKGISRSSVISQLAQKEEPWLLPLQNFEARKILRESHTGPFILCTSTFLYLIEIN
uniref:Zinc finger protein 774 n=1 Tax=Microcebus murinus TaxID=30608 RepID=A0A8C5W6I4_MICMU